MSSTGRTGRGAAVRLVAVLALVLGLVGMHGLAGSHHAAAAAPAHVVPAVAAVIDEPVLPELLVQRHAPPRLCPRVALTRLEGARPCPAARGT